MKAWASYTAIALVVAGLVVVAAMLLADPAVSAGIRFAAVVGFAVQVVAFGFLVRVRERPAVFLAGWVGGIALRFVVVGVVAFWVTRTEKYPPAPTLVSLVGIVFLMLMLEPLFLRKGLPAA
jgi:hypothetical protein